MAMYKKKPTGKVSKTKSKSGKVKKGKSLKGKKKQQSGWKNSPIIGVLCGVVILYCLWTTFIGGGNSGFKQDYVCNSCKAVMRVAMDIKTKSPYECPECGKIELYNANRCIDCKKITPLLPQKMDFTCTDCSHHEMILLDPILAPHNCPKCNKKTFYESYECLSCEHVYGHVPPTEEELKAQMDAPEDPSMFMGDQNSSQCPKCKESMTQSYNLEIMPKCVYCESDQLESVTPWVVMKKEMGRKLKAKEQKIYDAWEAKQ